MMFLVSLVALTTARFDSNLHDARRSLLADECLTNNGGCEQTCTDTVDSFLCSCSPGYSVNGNNGTCQACLEATPAVFAPVLTGQISLSAGTNLPALVLNIQSSNFENFTFVFPGCTASPVVTRTAMTETPADCISEYEVTINYRDDCSFMQTVTTDLIFLFGYITVSATTLRSWTGLTWTEEYSLPLGFKITLPKTVSATSQMSVKLADCCPLVESRSASCNNQTCAEVGGTGTNARDYLACICDACHDGLHCGADTCPPTPTCPSGLYIIPLTAGMVLTEATLRLLSVLPSSVSALDNVLSGGYTTSTEITITRQLGANPPTDVTAGDDLLDYVFSNIGIGTPSTVTYTFNDNTGAAASTCSFQVEVRDYGLPSITCPADRVDKTAVVWASPTVWDDLDPRPTLTLTSAVQPGAQAEGSHLVVYSVTDASGNMATCNFTVIFDQSAPVVTFCPGIDTDLNVPTGTGVNYYSHATAWAVTPATFSDALAGGVVIMVDYDGSGATPPTYPQQFALNSGEVTKSFTPVTFTATDAAGNIATCVVTVIVTDEEAPKFTVCPGQQDLVTDASLAVATFDMAPLVATSDNVGPVGLSRNYAGAITWAITYGTPFSVTYTATDAAGLTATCTFAIYVIDNQVPTITCPSNKTEPMDSGVATYTASWTVPTSEADNAGTVSSKLADVSLGSLLQGGGTVVTYTVTDPTGNQGFCSFTILVVDNQPPKPSCPTGTVIYNTDTGKNYFTADFLGSGAVSAVDNADARGDLIFTSNYVDAAALTWTTGAGTITVTYDVHDLSGNSVECSWQANVHDNQSPAIACADQTVLTDDLVGTHTHTAWTFNVTDNADTLSAFQVIYSPSSLVFNLGNTSVVSAVSDEDGNEAQCNFTVTVQQRCGDIYVMNGEECETTGLGCLDSCACNESSSYFKKVKQAAAVNCEFVMVAGLYQVPIVGVIVTGGGHVALSTTDTTAQVTIDVSPVLDSPQRRPFGATLQEIIGTDFLSIGVSAMDVRFSGTVIEGEYALMEVCPTTNIYTLTIILYLEGDSTAGIDSDDHCRTIGASGNPSVPVRLYNDTSGCWEFAICGTGITQVGNVNGTDWLQCDNLASVSGTTASGYTVDIDLAIAARTTMLPGGTTAGASLQADTDYGSFTDISSPYPFPPGTHGVTIKAVDNQGRVGGICVFQVLVADGVSPSLSGCSATLAVSLPMDAGQPYATLPAVDGIDETSFLPDLTDPAYTYLTDETQSITPTYSLTALSTEPSARTLKLRTGISTITWSVTDGAGNGPVTCVYTITVNDFEAPTLSCPAVTIATDSGVNTVTLAATPVQVNDNSWTAQQNQNATVGTYGIGRHDIYYQAADASGNVANCTSVLTVNDGEAPVPICPQDIVLETTSATVGATWIYSVTDNDQDNAQVVSFPLSPQTYAVKTTGSVTVTASDLGSTLALPAGSPNTAQCTFNVQVNDIGAPDLTCPPNQNVSTATATATLNYGIASVSDNSGETPGVVDDYGTNTFAVTVETTIITFHATDLSNNTGSCSFTVTVVDTGSPYSTSCPSDVTINSGDEADGVPSHDWWDEAQVVFEDFKGLDGTWDILGQNDNRQDIASFTLGANTITYTAKDVAGNSGVCSFTVTVVDTQKPVIVCPSSTSINLDPAKQTSVNFTFNISASDDYSSWNFITWSGHSIPSTLAAKVQSQAYSLGLGNTTFSFTAQDVANNQELCQFTVQVKDTIPPVITFCPSNVIDREFRSNPVVVNYGAAIATDNIGVISLDYSQDSSTVFPNGPTTVTVTATDVSGNSDTCSFVVDVYDAYPVFSADDVLSTVSRLFFDRSSGAFKVQLVYITITTFPYFLDPTDILAHQNANGTLTALSENTAKRACGALVSPTDVLAAIVETSSQPCYQHWDLALTLGSCSDVALTETLSHTVDCKPSDCQEDNFLVDIKLTLGAQDLCDVGLSPVVLDATLIILTPADKDAWVSSWTDLDTINPVASSTFDDASSVVGLIRVSSNQVLLQAVTLKTAVRYAYANAARTILISTVDLVKNGRADGTARIGGVSITVSTPIAPAIGDFAYVQWTEVDLAPESAVTTHFVTVEMTAEVHYDVGGVAGRRRVAMIGLQSLRAGGKARKQMLAVQEMTSINVRAGFTTSLNKVHNQGTQDNNDPTTPWVSTPIGIIVIVLIVLASILLIIVGLRWWNKRDSKASSLDSAAFPKHSLSSIITEDERIEKTMKKHSRYLRAVPAPTADDFHSPRIEKAKAKSPRKGPYDAVIDDEAEAAMETVGEQHPAGTRHRHVTVTSSPENENREITSAAQPRASQLLRGREQLILDDAHADLS
eukprot:gb/GEZN01000084.1/.p1 GENE.gb/GEZN01000084.1/~~gb/GEZN01000084.1/.p1  ORF type:complete len:2325 (+),score=252.12 gb/GEZN01000084.1/:200-7174(+)